MAIADPTQRRKVWFVDHGGQITEGIVLDANNEVVALKAGERLVLRPVRECYDQLAALLLKEMDKEHVFTQQHALRYERLQARLTKLQEGRA